MDSLVKNLDKNNIKCTSQEFDSKVLNLVKQKGYYPEACQASFKEKFYSSLTGKKKKKISDKEYEHVLKAWDKFEIKTMKDYHNLYIICGVLLLADVFKKYIKSPKTYGLCLSYYLSAPALS